MEEQQKQKEVLELIKAQEVRSMSTTPSTPESVQKPGETREITVSILCLLLVVSPLIFVKWVIVAYIFRWVLN